LTLFDALIISLQEVYCAVASKLYYTMQMYVSVEQNGAKVLMANFFN